MSKKNTGRRGRQANIVGASGTATVGFDGLMGTTTGSGLSTNKTTTVTPVITETTPTKTISPTVDPVITPTTTVEPVKTIAPTTTVEPVKTISPTTTVEPVKTITPTTTVEPVNRMEEKEDVETTTKPGFGGIGGVAPTVPARPAVEPSYKPDGTPLFGDRSESMEETPTQGGKNKKWLVMIVAGIVIWVLLKRK